MGRMVHRKERTQSRFFWVPSPVPFFYLCELFFLALLSVYFLRVWKREKRKSEVDGWVGRLLITGSGFWCENRELERLRVRLVWIWPTFASCGVFGPRLRGGFWPTFVPFA